ncbi:hypothetical protein [Streptosporangium sp. V21-05]|uniref:hypothetical protein n=1 Tax=Streptosporangium sp. V21-05 TaxID=3446115 RepID=UPI003F53101B
MPAQRPLTYHAFAELAAADPAVVGLVLKGSHAHDGMTTEHSDHDLYVVLADSATTDLTRFAGHRTPELDLVILPLAEFRAAGMPGFERYALARHPLPGWDTGVLLDAVDRVSGTGDVPLQRSLFARVEAAARRAGHGAVLDAWGEDLDLMRPR